MSEPLPSEKRLLKLLGGLITVWDKWPWIANSVAAIAALLVGAATAIDSIPSANLPTAIWVIGILVTALLMLIANRGASKRATRTKVLEQTIQELTGNLGRLRTSEDERKKRQTSELKSASRALLEQSGLNYDDTRISVYQRIEERSEFTLLVRVSKNPKLEMIGRPNYPDNIGLISQAWEYIGAHHSEWKVDSNEWVDSQVQKFNIPRDVATNIKMKSRSLLGVRVDYYHERVGIVIIESLERSRVTPGHRDAIPSLPAFGQIQIILQGLSRTTT